MNETAVAGPERASKKIAKMEERIVGSTPCSDRNSGGTGIERTRINTRRKKKKAPESGNYKTGAAASRLCCAARRSKTGVN